MTATVVAARAGPRPSCYRLSRNVCGLLPAACHPRDVAGIRGAVDATAGVTGHNGEVAGRAGKLIAPFARTEPREAPPTGWALAFDAAVAVGAAAGAVYEIAERSVQAVVVPA